MNEHRIRWYGIAVPSGERIPRTRAMPGRAWGWDAECSCGWRTRTGGAIQARIEDAIREHRWDVAHGYTETPLPGGAPMS